MTTAAADNRDKLLNAARSLLQSRGFNAFSFRDLAEIVQIKSSSVHYHFPTKEDLGVALVRGYTDELRAFFDQQEALEPSSRQGALNRLKAFAGLFEHTATGNERLCLAGMLASDFATLGDTLRRDVRSFFEVVEQWLSRQIALAGPPRSAARCRRLAQLMMAALEGALLTVRVFEDAARVKHAASFAMLAIQSPDS